MLLTIHNAIAARMRGTISPPPTGRSRELAGAGRIAEIMEGGCRYIGWICEAMERMVGIYPPGEG